MIISTWKCQYLESYEIKCDFRDLSFTIWQSKKTNKNVKRKQNTTKRTNIKKKGNKAKKGEKYRQNKQTNKQTNKQKDKSLDFLWKLHPIEFRTSPKHVNTLHLSCFTIRADFCKLYSRHFLQKWQEWKLQESLCFYKLPEQRKDPFEPQIWKNWTGFPGRIWRKRN